MIGTNINIPYLIMIRDCQIFVITMFGHQNVGILDELKGPFLAKWNNFNWHC